MNTHRLALIFAALVPFSFALEGCAADSEGGDEETHTEVVTVAPSDGELTPQMLGRRVQFYTANVRRGDIIGGGGTCAGNLCSLGGQTWDCSGGGLCSNITN
jgi:hypothetical protein